MHDNDQVEGWRSYWFPILDRLFGHARGLTRENQYVATVRQDEETFERDFFHRLGARRNGAAYYKSTEDGRDSEGSWVFLYDDMDGGTNPWDTFAAQGRLPDDPVRDDQRQIHVTLYESRDYPEYIELYAHEEYDWRSRPWAHLRERYFRPKLGRDMARWLLDQHTFLARDEDYYIR